MTTRPGPGEHNALITVVCAACALVAVGAAMTRQRPAPVRVGAERAWVCRAADRPAGDGEFRVSLDAAGGVWVEAP